mmetsp:Transcript_3644/g.6709  ORF Transcript_3644/g.6709 Transcript_3644/m.6709 type:complete len:267 (+) Transcript_3644:2167-2967(+)
MGMNMIGPARGGVSKEGFLVQTHHHAVIHQEAVLRAHQPVAAFARLQVAHHVGVQHVHQLARVRPLDDDLAKGRGIEQPERAARGIDLADHRVAMALACLREAVRTPPATDGLHVGPLRYVPVVHRRAAQRLEDLAARLAGDGPHGNRRVGRPEGGGADPGDGLVQRISQDRQTVDVAQLSLIRRHAERRVALGMFDALVALARGQLHVRNLHVVLEIQPHLRAFLVARPMGHDPDRRQRILGSAAGGAAFAHRFTHLLQQVGGVR